MNDENTAKIEEYYDYHGDTLVAIDAVGECAVICRLNDCYSLLWWDADGDLHEGDSCALDDIAAYARMMSAVDDSDFNYYDWVDEDVEDEEDERQDD